MSGKPTKITVPNPPAPAPVYVVVTSQRPSNHHRHYTQVPSGFHPVFFQNPPVQISRGTPAQVHVPAHQPPPPLPAQVNTPSNHSHGFYQQQPPIQQAPHGSGHGHAHSHTQPHSNHGHGNGSRFG